MCGRYNLIPDPTAWADVGAILSEGILTALRAMPPRHNVAPTQLVPIIVMGNDGRPALIQARWGFIPHYWNKPQPPPMTTNVRSETAAVKPMWKFAWRNQRCLVPASGWYEWFILEDGSKKPPKVPHHLRPRDGKHLLFAGVWSIYRSAPDSSGIPTCSIATIASPPSVAEIHARTPVVLKPEFWHDWIDPTIKDPAAVNEMVKQGAVRLFAKHTLGPAIGNSRNEGPDLVVPADRPEAAQKDLQVDEPILDWLRATPGDELTRTIAGRLDQIPPPTAAERRLWLRELEDRDDADRMSALMEEIRATLRSGAKRPPKDERSEPPQGSLF